MIIAPSLLTSNHACLGKGAERAGRSGADWLHLDIMFISFQTFSLARK